MTVGQEFHAFGSALEGEIQLLKDSEKYLYPVNMGATAIGTGINVPKGYTEAGCDRACATLTGKPIVPATDLLAATWDQQGFVVYSSALKSTAIKLSKIASDLILLTFGPPRGSCGDRFAGIAAGLIDHARQGQSGHSGAHQRHRIPGHRQRCRNRLRGAFGATAAQRL